MTHTAFEIKKAFYCLEQLSRLQPLRQQTLAAHAAAIYGYDLELMTVAEDVGRHNALDKAIGKVFLTRKLAQAALLILSSRISYELVQKSARARIPIILAHSRPTAARRPAPCSRRGCGWSFPTTALRRACEREFLLQGAISIESLPRAFQR